MDNNLLIEDLQVKVGDRSLFAPINTKIASGEILTIMGPSGSGKSTILNAIAGLLEAPFVQSGRLLLNGVDITHIPTHMRKVGLMFQDDMLFSHMSIGENLLFGLKSDRMVSHNDRLAMRDEALLAAELPDVADHYPAQLSGGQRSRISLMRTLLYNPRCILMDEPFSSLDTQMRSRMRQFVYQQLHNKQIPALIVTHDVQDHHEMGGKLLQIGQSGQV